MKNLTEELSFYLDNANGIIPTEKWLIALDDYKKQLFSGKDFLEIKATYILVYFDGDLERYNTFAKNHFYSNDVLFAPQGEFPFLGEIKIPDNITPDDINTLNSSTDLNNL